MSKPVVIIGAGHAGTQFVMSFRQIGDTRALILISDDIDYPYHKPPLSKAFLKTTDAPLQYLRPPSFYENNAVELRLKTSVLSIKPENSQIELQNGELIDYDQLVIATGARPKMPKIDGADVKGVVALRNVSDALILRENAAIAKNIVVMGGGFVGLEVASTLAAQGKQVTVLEAGTRILARVVAKEVSEFIHQQLVEQGVRIMVNSSVMSVDSVAGRITAVETTNKEKFSADLLLVGIGADVNSELAVPANIACDNGIVVDQQMRTSVDNIYAIGDCASYHHWLSETHVRLESVQNATDQARLAVKTITGSEETYRDVPWFWSEIAGHRLQMVGLAFDVDEVVVSGSIKEAKFSVYHFCKDKLVAIDSINQVSDHMLGRKFFDKAILPSKDDVHKGSDYLKEFFKNHSN